MYVHGRSVPLVEREYLSKMENKNIPTVRNADDEWRIINDDRTYEM